MTASVVEAPSGASLPANCGDVCPALAFTLATIGDHATPEENMAMAVNGVREDKLSIRAAAKLYKVSFTSLQRKLTASKGATTDPNGSPVAGQEGATTDPNGSPVAPSPLTPGEGWNRPQLVDFAQNCGITNAGGVRTSKATRVALIEALGDLLIGAEKPATAAPATSSRKAAVKPAAAVQQAAKPPAKPDRYKTEWDRIERLLAVRTALQEQLKELELLAKTRNGDEAGSLAHAPDWHQRVVAYVEQHEPQKAEKLGVKATDGRWLLAVMDDLERLGHNCHGKVNAALAAHGYLDLHGREPNSTRYNWTKE
jgi:hypothetical protein